MPEEPAIEYGIEPLAPTERLVARPPLSLRDARTGAPSRGSTALRLGWRENRLLIRFDCRHRGIVATLREDNAALWTEDVVEAFIAFDDPPGRYLELEVNPLGARFSAVVDSPRLCREGMTVQTFPFAEFKAEVRVREDRWNARLSIPLKNMFERLSTPAGLRDPEGKRTAAEGPTTPKRFVATASREDSAGGEDGSPREFRANFFRIDRTSGEFSALYPTMCDPPDFHRPSAFGKFRLRA